MCHPQFEERIIPSLRPSQPLNLNVFVDHGENKYVYIYNINKHGIGTSSTIIIMIMLVVYRQLSVL